MGRRRAPQLDLRSQDLPADLLTFELPTHSVHPRSLPAHAAFHDGAQLPSPPPRAHTPASASPLRKSQVRCLPRLRTRPPSQLVGCVCLICRTSPSPFGRLCDHLSSSPVRPRPGEQHPEDRSSRLHIPPVCHDPSGLVANVTHLPYNCTF